jgi:hypothetical protein
MAAQPVAAQRPGEQLRRSMERGMASYAFEPAQWSRAVQSGLRDRGAYVTALVLATAPANPVAAGDDEGALVRSLVADPVYQLR